MVEDLELEEDVMEVFMAVEMGDSEVVEAVVIEAVEVVAGPMREVGQSSSGAGREVALPPPPTSISDERS